MTTSSLINPAYKDWLESGANPYETILLLEKSEVSEVDLSDISDALEEYVRLFKAEIASPAEILTLSRAYPDEEKYSLAVIDKELDQKEPVVIGGPASVEVVDREGHLITVAAMKRAFDRFMENFRTRNAMVLHSDVQVGWALPAYISKTGKVYKSGVTGDHLFFITELRDDTKISKKVLEQINTGKMKSYSIAGSATSVEPSKKDGGVIMQVNDMELAEVTICEQGVNQRAKFELMKADADRPTSSCVDGSCLIKSQEHKHSETEIIMNSNGEIDTVGSFLNWTQKSIYDDPAERMTPEEEAEHRRKIRAMNERDSGKRSVGRYTGPPPEAPKGKEILEENSQMMEKQLEDQLFVDADVEAEKGERKSKQRDTKVKARGVKFPLRTPTVRRNVGRRTIQKSSLDQLEDHLVEKGIGDIARGAGKAVGAAVEGVKNVGREFKSGVDSARPKTAGEASAHMKPPTLSWQPPRGKAGEDPNVTIRDKDAAKVGKGFREYMANRAAAKEGGKKNEPKQSPSGRINYNPRTGKDFYAENMQKSHSHGCGCETCGSAASWHTHGDDTSRPATDRHGRPTLGHTGHGHAVAILISRMHRKGDVVPFESQDDKDTRETVEKTRRMTYNYIAANPETFPDHHKNTDFSKPYDPETDSGLKPAIQQHQMKRKYKQNPEGTMNMAKAVYQFIHKFGAMGGGFKPGKAPKAPKPPGSTGVPEKPGQQIAEAKKEDESGGQKQAPVQQTPSYGGKGGGWLKRIIEGAQDIAGVRHGQPKEIPTMNMEKQEAEWKTPQIEKDWKQQKQGIPRASQRKMRQGWDQSAGIGGSNQSIGFTGMSEK